MDHKLVFLNLHGIFNKISGGINRYVFQVGFGVGILLWLNFCVFNFKVCQMAFYNKSYKKERHFGITG